MLGGQAEAGSGIAAGEGDSAAVVLVDVAELILGRHREGQRRAGVGKAAGGAGNAGIGAGIGRAGQRGGSDHKVVGRQAGDDDPRGRSRVVVPLVAVIVCVPAVLSTAQKCQCR